MFSTLKSPCRHDAGYQDCDNQIYPSVCISFDIPLTHYTFVNKQKCKANRDTSLFIGDNQLHVSVIYSHLEAEYRFIIGENTYVIQCNKEDR